jgi:hypothetical protein
MAELGVNPTQTGLEVIDLQSYPEFKARKFRVRDDAAQIEGMDRLARAFVEKPEAILQELVNLAVELCGADSAGITMERQDKDCSDERIYEWVATAGEYAHFLNARLPPTPNPCRICLERGGPQLFRVSQPFFDLIGVEAPLVTDGLLLPWEVDETRGTVWIIAHGRTEAFDGNDCRLMEVLANFAAMGVRQQRQQKSMLEHATAEAAAAMANDLAHRINNPLQSLTNLVYIAAEGEGTDETKALATAFSDHLARLTVLVGELLTLPSARK